MEVHDLDGNSYLDKQEFVRMMCPPEYKMSSDDSPDVHSLSAGRALEFTALLLRYTVVTGLGQCAFFLSQVRLYLGVLY